MMKKHYGRKAAAISLAAAMAAGSLTGCGGKKEAAAGSDGRYQIKAMTYDYFGNPMKGDVGAEIMDKVEDYMNMDLEVMWTPKDSYDDKLNLVLAGGGDDMPQIIATELKSPAIINAARAGALWDVEALMQEFPHLKNAKTVVNDNIRIDGKLYGIYRGRALGRNGMAYRKDWMDKLGLDTPETIEDVYNMLYAFTYDDPDGNGQDDTYGLALSKYTAPLDIMQTWFGAPNGWGEVDGKLIPVHQTEEYLEALRWFRKLCEEGLIKKDFPTRDVATKSDDLKTQKAGVIVDALDDGRRVADYFENQNIEGPEIDFVGAVKKDENSQPKTMATLGCQGFFVITKAAKTEDDVRKCLEFLDKMNDEEMLTMANYGLEGNHFQMGDDGKLTRSHDATLNQEYQALNQLVSYTEYPPNMDPYVTLNETEVYDKQQATIAANEQYTVSNPAAGILGDSAEYTKNGVALDKIIEDARIQYIVGQIDEDQLKAQWDLWSKSGGDKVIEEVNAVYAQMK
ncbi:MAG: extracellular solute-binding protein [Lachnospiraceae bacterium]|nr:extracellular solute-binding protein [Lachnospiraceae bacterium]MDO5550021.1 extracellular solute-binding protein [Lachnospiraceae bacterium]